jgi:hypothetical protein
MYLWPKYYSLENIVHYENSNERYEFSIRAARNTSWPTCNKAGIIKSSHKKQLCTCGLQYIQYYTLENIVHYENSNERYIVFSGILYFHNILPDIILSGMLRKYNVLLKIISRNKKCRKCTESVKQPKIEVELEYTRGFLRYSL